MITYSKNTRRKGHTGLFVNSAEGTSRQNKTKTSTLSLSQFYWYTYFFITCFALKYFIGAIKTIQKEKHFLFHNKA